MIDEKIIQVLIRLTHFDKSFHYEFTHETISPNSPYAKGVQRSAKAVQRSWVEQFISDLIVFGLREAILYLHDYEFESDASELIRNSISLYHEVARLYLLKRRDIETSKDEKIQRLLMITKLSGEGQPQHLASR
jgi:F0F1-type ATP synthase gamma subunit